MSRASFLREIETNVQKKWGRTEFEANAPVEYDEKDKNKFFVTFPFPYQNANLHLGHVFSLLKADIMARHYRTRGYNTLFPFAHHVSGIPICAAANRLAEEFKSGNLGKQYEILLKADIPEDLIPNFVDPIYWTKYFPRISLETDLPALGCAIDYRRSFITTELNPHFDSFVKWQFNQLNAKGYLKFGKKMVIYSQKDGQPCSDADRTIGEGVEIREMKVAFITGIQGSYFVTYDKNAPADRVVKSKSLNLKTYQADDSKIVSMTEYFYDNYRHQSKEYVNNNSTKISDDVKEISFELESCELSHGSGLYTSNPDLEWFTYYEPEKEVVSRSGDRCIVAEIDQWLILYDNEEWRNSVYHHVDTHVKFTDSVVKSIMLKTIAKSHPWPFSRTFGLGTKIPFDTKYIIDSLSDSTIYMAYYTVAHLITNIPVTELSDDVWFSVFFNKETDISRRYPDLFKTMQREFQYWYPLDLRVSGKDLITNHLTMMFFNHMAIFGTDYMPRMLYANGHVMVNGEKMSKAKGNFITLKQAVDRYGVDVTRFIAGSAGDDIEDASFDERYIDPTVLGIYAEVQNWSKIDFTKMRTGNLEFYDQLHLISLNKILTDVEKAYSEIRFRDVVKIGFYEIQLVRNKYLNPHRDVVKLFLQAELAMISPFIPHWTQYMSETYKIPAIWPKITIDPQYDNIKTQWLFKYCEMIGSKVGDKIKKVQKHNHKMCQVLINNKIDIYLDKISQCDISDRDKRRDILKNLSDKKESSIMIELFTHMDKFAESYGKNNIIQWLHDNHSVAIKSCLEIFYPKYMYEVIYDNSTIPNPFSPTIVFS